MIFNAKLKINKDIEKKKVQNAGTALLKMVEHAVNNSKVPKDLSTNHDFYLYGDGRVKK